MSESIPFEDPTTEGRGAAHGVVRLDGTVLVIEYRVKRGHVSLESEVHTVKLPLGDTGIDIEKRWFRVELVIQAARLTDVEEFPGAEQGRLVLQIPRKYTKAARELIEAARVRALDRKIDEMRKEVDDLARK